MPSAALIWVACRISSAVHAVHVATCSQRHFLANACKPADFSCYSLLRHWLPGKAPLSGAADQPRSLWQALADAGSAIVCGGLAGMVGRGSCVLQCSR